MSWHFDVNDLAKKSKNYVPKPVESVESESVEDPGLDFLKENMHLNKEIMSLA